MEHLGFSYIGALWLLMLFVPNLFWTKRKPQGYSSEGESGFLLAFDRVGEALVTCFALIFSDFNLHTDAGLWNLWLAASLLCMLLYEYWWVRYFRSEKKLHDFYSSLWGIPVAGATLPVAAFLLLGIYGRVIWMILAALILGVGHVGIHLQHQKQMK